MIPWRSLPILGLVLGLLLGSASCSSVQPGRRRTPPEHPSSNPAPFPPRPVQIALQGIKPCSLLTPNQLLQLGLFPGTRGDDTDELGSTACVWSNAATPDNGWTVRLVTKRGAEYAMRSTADVQVVEVGGFGAVQTAPPDDDPAHNCVLVIDVAQGQSLNVKYNNFSGDYPGMTHEIACQLDRKVAEMVVANLRALTR